MIWFRKRKGIDDIFDYIDMKIWRTLKSLGEIFPERIGIFEEIIDRDYNIFEEEDKYIIEIELPGVKKEDINVEIKDRYLIVYVKKKIEKEKKQEGYYISKKFYSGFKKVILLPPDADLEKIRAKYSNGILRIEIDKITTGGRKIELE